MSSDESFHTIIIGGGQAGLAAAYYLAQARKHFVVLESHPRIGETWRTRWDSLRLFTPAKFNGLPGMPFPADDFYFPTKDEVVTYLQNYTNRFAVPLQLNTRVKALSRSNSHFEVTTSSQTFSASNVIVATGAYQVPKVPKFSAELSPSISQLHSSSYKNPGRIRSGNVLVVGAGNSGAEIAIELTRAGHGVWLAGRDVGRIPSNELGMLFGGKPYWTLISRVLSVHTPMGRRVRKKAMRQGTPLIRLKPREITDAGVLRCNRVQGVQDGKPLLSDGTILDVQTIIWATGYRPEYDWIQLPGFPPDDYPPHSRGVVPGVPGLYFVGLHFQTALSSALLGGVDRDARAITAHLLGREKT